MTINERITQLRQELSNRGLWAYIIPSNDPHQSEYVAAHWQSREWISGFTGSAGTVIITEDHAGLWTDSRYFLQAEEEISDSEMVLHKLRIPHTAQHVEWILANCPSQAMVGVDGWMFSAAQVQRLKQAFGEKDIKLNTQFDLMSEIWENRPALPATKVQILPERFAGESASSKLDRLRAEMKVEGANEMILSSLDDIAWALNIRGRDISYSPVNISYLRIGVNSASLYINPDKLDEELNKYLEGLTVDVKSYDSIQNDLASLNKSGKTWIDTGSLAFPLVAEISSSIIDKALPCESMKACKNEVEIAGIRKAMINDGVALTRLFMWLEKEVQSRAVPETEIAEKLAGFRSEQEEYVEESFPAIVGYKGNGAIVHYRPEEGKCASVEADGILLLDSGGQYRIGTTDITRTVAMGTPTQEQKDNFTRVLQGNIALDKLIFPVGTTGSQMDILARQPLWAAGLNYGHGTGHGVGHFLNVHEGPQSIGPGKTAKTGTIFKKGMLTSNEPGFYKTGEYGIRIENLVICEDGPQTDFGSFYQFETVTLFPIDQQLISFPLLRREEVKWLNEYHEKVYTLLSPALNTEEKEWLMTKCKSIS